MWVSKKLQEGLDALEAEVDTATPVQFVANGLVGGVKGHGGHRARFTDTRGGATSASRGGRSSGRASPARRLLPRRGRVRRSSRSRACLRRGAPRPRRARSPCADAPPPRASVPRIAPAPPRHPPRAASPSPSRRGLPRPAPQIAPRTPQDLPPRAPFRSTPRRSRSPLETTEPLRRRAASAPAAAPLRHRRGRDRDEETPGQSEIFLLPRSRTSPPSRTAWAGAG